MFFCAVVGDRTYLRFVLASEDWRANADDDGIVREVGTCLRLIECEEDTPTWYPDTLQEPVYDFWEVAQQDIWTDWMRETDPANLQPKVRPLNLRVAEFIRENPPIDLPEDRGTRALDILESPWPRREEMMLRDWFESEELDGSSLSNFLIELKLVMFSSPLVTLTLSRGQRLNALMGAAAQLVQSSQWQ